MKETKTKRKSSAWAFRLVLPLMAVACQEVNGEGISSDDSRFVAWADRVENFNPGPVDIRHPEWGTVSFGSPESATGRADAVRENPVQVVSLGDGGSVTLEFTDMIADGKGPDFAVFENGFVDTFLELAFVEVSSDGVHYFRFPSVSRTPIDTQIGPFDLLSSSNVDQLAGKYGAGLGTPFDLADLEEVDEELLDLNFVRFVKIIDVVGSVQGYGATDSKGNMINDPFPTPYLSGGFDLDAIGVINEPEDYPGWMGNYVDYSVLPDWTEPEADPDEDGRPNFMEYAMETSPLTSNANAGAPEGRWETLESGEQALRFPSFRAREEVRQTVEVSADMVSWETLVEMDEKAVPMMVKDAAGYRVAMEVAGDVSGDYWWLVRDRSDEAIGESYLRLGFEWLEDSGESE